MPAAMGVIQDPFRAPNGQIYADVKTYLLANPGEADAYLAAHPGTDDPRKPSEGRQKILDLQKRLIDQALSSENGLTRGEYDWLKRMGATIPKEALKTDSQSWFKNPATTPDERIAFERDVLNPYYAELGWIKPQAAAPPQAPQPTPVGAAPPTQPSTGTDYNRPFYSDAQRARADELNRNAVGLRSGTTVPSTVITPGQNPVRMNMPGGFLGGPSLFNQLGTPATQGNMPNMPTVPNPTTPPMGLGRMGGTSFGMGGSSFGPMQFKKPKKPGMIYA